MVLGFKKKKEEQDADDEAETERQSTIEEFPTDNPEAAMADTVPATPEEMEEDPEQALYETTKSIELEKLKRSGIERKARKEAQEEYKERSYKMLPTREKATIVVKRLHKTFDDPKHRGKKIIRTGKRYRSTSDPLYRSTIKAPRTSHEKALHFVTSSDDVREMAAQAKIESRGAAFEEAFSGRGFEQSMMDDDMNRHIRSFEDAFSKGADPTARALTFEAEMKRREVEMFGDRSVSTKDMNPIDDANMIEAKFGEAFSGRASGLEDKLAHDLFGTGSSKPKVNARKGFKGIVSKKTRLTLAEDGPEMIIRRSVGLSDIMNLGSERVTRMKELGLL
jgi:hypothetical protein